MIRESLDSPRIRSINHQTTDLRQSCVELRDSLVEKNRVEALEGIESLRKGLNILKDQIVHGDII
ncbi:hypothetical protein Phi40:1_gp010 [Cellulophaga phage phi40:1]|mgnify:CR=1 FL=1|uniref:Uncharacterized protein n=1 Tax=Cellulophaga phage phi38:1 TaxID=1327977 RepID=R9ZZV6_9CAUD|nr:hypothetical protein Phi38:1_gp010 [Cellulophaga phage phi38:1]AGO47875.1 hypothetical protein Phi40:1_gp010 [Cellulophaga phage phi40:1]AGO48040.1 hypothetical protein Phi38:1_gp010 [Cellulophaga phage phi38:1]